ncbi:MAG: hypothetical protein FJY73_07990 [Candidatus Eisenbacteria bacterium]|nr:hypothetical protein [Candidatus Eisenbacteria bacterium]
MKITRAFSVFAIAALALPSSAETVPRKKIAVLEKAFDATLVESANALVRRGEIAYGVHIEGYGVLFKMEFQFVDPTRLQIMEHLDNLDSLKAYWKGVIEKEKQGGAPSERTRAQLDRIEEELVETLVDYGGTLGPLGEGEFVTILAFPWEGTWEVWPRPVRSLLITARYEDLRAHAEGRLDTEAVRSRVRILEESK